MQNAAGEEEATTGGARWTFYLLPPLVLTILTVVLGLLAEPIYQLSLSAAEQLADPAGYVQAVLGGLR